jgi:hypothetical protein
VVEAGKVDEAGKVVKGGHKGTRRGQHERGRFGMERVAEAGPLGQGQWWLWVRVKGFGFGCNARPEPS